MALWYTLYVSHDVSPKVSLNEAKYLTSDNLECSFLLSCGKWCSLLLIQDKVTLATFSHPRGYIVHGNYGNTSHSSWFHTIYDVLIKILQYMSQTLHQ